MAAFYSDSVGSRHLSRRTFSMWCVMAEILFVWARLLLRGVLVLLMQVTEIRVFFKRVRLPSRFIRRHANPHVRVYYDVAIQWVEDEAVVLSAAAPPAPYASVDLASADVALVHSLFAVPRVH